MAEDSGAFKTIPRDWSKSGIFNARDHRRGRGVTLWKKARHLEPDWFQTGHFVPDRPRRLRYPEFGLIRGGERGHFPLIRWSPPIP
jgi:hypothetical protein